jgi:hypothetical protein
MTANHSEGGIGPTCPENEKAGGEAGNLSTGKESSSKLSVSAEAVKLEARRHLVRWLETGQEYHLRLARAKFGAVRKGAA